MSSLVKVIFVEVSTTEDTSTSRIGFSTTGVFVGTTGRTGIGGINFSSDVISVVISL